MSDWELSRAFWQRDPSYATVRVVSLKEDDDPYRDATPPCSPKRSPGQPLEQPRAGVVVANMALCLLKTLF